MDDKQGNSEKQAPQSEARETSAPPPSNNSSTGAPAPYNYSSPKPKSGKKVLIWVFSILAVLLLLLGGASVLAYNFWYQNPEKVILESVVNGFAANTVKVNSESTFEIKGWDNELANIKFNKLRFNTAAHQKNAFGTYGVQLDGVVDLKTNGSVKSSVPFTLSAKAMISEDNGKVFVKVDKVEPLFDAIKKVAKHYDKDSESDIKYSDFADKNDAAIRKIIKKLDDQWISFSGDFSTPEKFYSCIRDNYNKLSDEQKNSEKKIVADIYQNHKFIKVGDYLGSKNGSLGYKYDIDAKKLAEFLQDLSKNKATISGISSACLNDPEYGSGKDSKDKGEYERYYNRKSDEELKKERIDQFTEKFEKIEGELWTTRFGHKITSGKTTVVMKNIGDSKRVTVNTSYESTIDGEVKASRPENAKDATKLWEELQNDFKSLVDDYEKSLADKS